MKQKKQLMAVVVLGGMLKKIDDGTWRTTHYNERVDDIGPMGDRIRVDAAAYLYRSNPSLLIIVSGRKGKLNKLKNAPIISSIIKKELIALNVPKHKIIEEKRSENTHQQLQELKKIIIKRQLERVGIISNEWHLPRIKAMIGTDPELKKLQSAKKILLLSADRIVLENEPDIWQEVIKKAYASKELKKRIALEKMGIRQIKNGSYKFKN